MKRVLGIVAVCLLLCGCTAQPQEPQESQPTLPPPVPVVVPVGERTETEVTVTIHAGLLGMNSEVLSDTQIADGFIGAVRNEDNSVTYTIAADRYDAFVAKNRQNTHTMIDEMVRGNYPSVTGIECSEDLSEITLRVIRANYEQSVDAIAVFAAGLSAITEQAYNLDSPGSCVITVFDENGEQLSVTHYPEELVL